MRNFRTFRWFIHRDGYELVKNKETWPSKEAHEAGEPPILKTIIRPKGGATVENEPLETAGLYRVLAEMPATSEGVLRFFSIYGPMRPITEKKPYFVEECQDFIKTIRKAVRLADEEKWAVLMEHMPQFSRIGKIGKTSAIFTYSDQDERPHLWFQPMNLANAILLEFMQDCVRDTQLRQCEFCHIWFKFGPGTGRRNTARYCSSKCQSAHAYIQRKKRKEAPE